MSIYALSGFISGIISLILGLFVYFKNRKREINKIFGLLSVSIILWGFSYGMWQISTDKTTALFWTKALSAGVIFIPIFFYHWILVLTNLKTEKKKTLYFGYFMSLLFLVFLPTSLFVKTVEPELNFLWWPKAGLLFYPYVILNYIGLMGYGFYLLLKTYKKTEGYKREQIKYTIIGTFLGIGGGATNIPLWFGIHLTPFGTFLVPSLSIYFRICYISLPLDGCSFCFGKRSGISFFYYYYFNISFFITIC